MLYYFQDINKKRDMEKYDIVIVGAGPAGLAAALYASRRSLKTLVLSMDVGGQTVNTREIENYPGIDMIAGADLSQKILAQAKKFGAEIVTGKKIGSIEKEDGLFVLKSEGGEEYKSESVILAFGKTPRKLDIAGADEFLGKGLSYCATCDGPFFRGKEVAVIGGGNSAIDAALYLSTICSKVYLVHRRDAFRGEDLLVEQMKNSGNIELVLNSVVSGISGGDVIEKLTVKDVSSGEEKEVSLSGVFVEIGYEVDADFVKDLVKTDERNQIIVDSDCKTSCEGVFAAGDMTQVPYKQIVISTGQGAVAALSACDYVKRKRGEGPIRADWGQK